MHNGATELDEGFFQELIILSPICVRDKFISGKDYVTFSKKTK